MKTKTIIIGAVAYLFYLSWFIFQTDLYLDHRRELLSLKKQWGSCPILRDGWVVECNNSIHRLEFKYRHYECVHSGVRGIKDNSNVVCFFKGLPDLLK